MGVGEGLTLIGKKIKCDAPMSYSFARKLHVKCFVLHVEALSFPYFLWHFVSASSEPNLEFILCFHYKQAKCYFKSSLFWLGTLK